MSNIRCAHILQNLYMTLASLQRFDAAEASEPLGIAGLARNGLVSDFSTLILRIMCKRSQSGMEY